MAMRDGYWDRYTTGAIAFHWIIAALVILNLAIGIGHDALKGIPAMPIHKALGITVLLLSVARLGWRVGHRPPPLPASVPGWQVAVAHLNHALFYALMIALPLSGWWMVSAAETRRPLDWFGLFPIPYLPVAPGSPSGAAAHSGHEVMGWLMLALVVLHVAAALKHQLIDRDGTLARIAPILGGRRAG